MGAGRETLYEIDPSLNIVKLNFSIKMQDRCAKQNGLCQKRLIKVECCIYRQSPIFSLVTKNIF